MLRPDALRVLYQDAHFLALDKPSGVATTAPADGPSLFAAARAFDRAAPQLHPLSRLDTQVTGLVVFARTALANDGVLAARRAGALRRRYLGLTSADSSLVSEGRWEWPIGIDPRDPRRRRALAQGSTGAGVKLACTEYRVRARAPAMVALDLFPQTGRTHQLRVHAAKAGAPLLGDVTYGGLRRLTLPNGRILSAGRVMLHCREVRLPHPDPALGELRLCAPVPEDLLRLWTSGAGDPEPLERDRDASGASP